MSDGLIVLLRARARMIWNSVLALRHHSKLKIFIILLFGGGLWAGLYWLFMDGFRFMGSEGFIEFRPMVIPIMFAVFFLSLLVMLMFSSGIIAYGSLFRSDETAFLMARPIRAWRIFCYKLIEALLFSSWAFLFLAAPLIVALGVDAKSPWYYYPGAAAFFVVFSVLPAAIGGSVTLLVARFLSRSPRRVFLLLALAALFPLTIWGLGVIRTYRTGLQSSEVWMQGVLGHLSLSRIPVLPSYWMSSGLLDLSEGKLGQASYRFLLLLSTALFAGMVAVHLARAFYMNAYQRTQALLRKRRPPTVGRFYRLLESCLPFSADLRGLIVKDVKTFLRDPVQWSQVLIFFGLLGIYFVNMRNLRYNLDRPFWPNLISILNLVATSLTLSTFTSRFIFPLLSLEGRKFWILGLLPIRRRDILYSKFWFAFAGSLFISESLMTISDLILKLPLQVMALHWLAMLLICAGLSALSVGVGALYPNLHEDNPSKIVSGFGGTLNLVLSIGYVAIVVLLLTVPYHLSDMQGAASGMRRYLLIGGIGALAAGILAVVFPLWLGVKAFERLET